MRIERRDCDDSACRIELLIETGIVKESRVSSLLNEAEEILSMVVASIRTSRK